MKSKVLIIAEAGVNHNGNLQTALKMIDVAADAGADIVKFQTFQAAKLVTGAAKMAEYQKNNTGVEQSQLEMLRKLELSYDQHHILIEKCRERDIRFLSTAFDFESLAFLTSLKMGLWKIPSGEITNLPYLEKIGRLREPTILSTGMADFNEVSEAVAALMKAGLERDKITVLHCNTEYPTPMHDVNLRAMGSLGRTLDVQYGYSDHTLGIEVPIAAVALGASVIEKHFTLSRDSEGPDHRASLEPQELKQMVAAIRNIETALGDDKKSPTSSEIKNRVIARKSIVAFKSIKVGEVFSEDNLTTRRPGAGISPMKWYEVLGKSATKDYAENDLIAE